MTSAAGPETDLPPPYSSVEFSSPPYQCDVTLPRYDVSEAPPPYSLTEANITSLTTSNQVTSGCSNPLGEQTNAQVPRNENVSAAAERQLHNQLFTTQCNNCRPYVFSVSRNVLPINTTNRNINASKDNNIRTVSRNQGWYSSRHFVNAQERRRRRAISTRHRVENQNTEPKPYFWLTVCVCVCCCFAVGIFAVLFSEQVKAANARQDYKKARRYSYLTIFFTVFTILSGLGIYTYTIVFFSTLQIGD